MNEIRRIEIVFKGELFLDTFSAHQKKYQALNEKIEYFRERVSIKILEIIEMTKK